jgi:hypothetical protein
MVLKEDVASRANVDQLDPKVNVVIKDYMVILVQLVAVGLAQLVLLVH